MDGTAIKIQDGDILFRGAQGLLQFGPIGLAALMLILVVIALSVRTLSLGRERLLRQFMYVGAGCFALSILAAFWSASHVVHFKVYPQGLVAFKLPPPVLSVEDEKLTDPFHYRFWTDDTAIIDVSASVNLAASLRASADQATADAAKATVDLASAKTEVEKSTVQLATAYAQLLENKMLVEKTTSQIRNQQEAYFAFQEQVAQTVSLYSAAPSTVHATCTGGLGVTHAQVDLGGLTELGNQIKSRLTEASSKANAVFRQ